MILKVTHALGEQSAKVNNTQKSSTEHGTETDLTKDVLCILVIIQILFHDSFVLELFCALIFTCGLATANGIITDAPGWLLPVVPSPGDMRLCCIQSVTFCPIYLRSRWRFEIGAGFEPANVSFADCDLNHSAILSCLILMIVVSS